MLLHAMGYYSTLKGKENLLFKKKNMKEPKGHSVI